jgi:hypothetical protein
MQVCSADMMCSMNLHQLLQEASNGRLIIPLFGGNGAHRPDEAACSPGTLDTAAEPADTGRTSSRWPSRKLAALCLADHTDEKHLLLSRGFWISAASLRGAQRLIPRPPMVDLPTSVQDAVKTW